jgi:hypothetical protein
MINDVGRNITTRGFYCRKPGVTTHFFGDVYWSHPINKYIYNYNYYYLPLACYMPHPFSHPFDKPKIIFGHEYSS